MNLLSLINSLLSETGKGKGRNLNRIGMLGLCVLIYGHTKDLPQRAAAIEARLARVENRLGIANFPTVATNQFAILTK